MNNNALGYDLDLDATRERIASNFSAEMKRARWSGRSMAAALGLTQPYVARRAAGTVEMSGSDLALFAKFLEIPVSRFFVEPDDETSPELAPVRTIPAHSEPEAKITVR